MLDLVTMLLGTFSGYILLYGVCWGVDKYDIKESKKKVRLNKYTNMLFFLWKRSEKVYWLAYIINITGLVYTIVFVCRIYSCCKNFDKKNKRFYQWKKQVIRICVFIKPSVCERLELCIMLQRQN